MAALNHALVIDMIKAGQRLAADCSCQPPLICPSCQCAWPGLMPGRDDTVTCSCGRLLGCAMRDR